MLDFCSATLFGAFGRSFSFVEQLEAPLLPSEPGNPPQAKRCQHHHGSTPAARRQRRRPRGTATRSKPKSALRAAVSKADVMKCLSREYRSFFAPLEDEYYSSSVTFDDPLNSLSGLKAYRNNVDMLAGRTLIWRPALQRRGDQFT